MLNYLLYYYSAVNEGGGGCKSHTRTYILIDSDTYDYYICRKTTRCSLLDSVVPVTPSEIFPVSVSRSSRSPTPPWSPSSRERRRDLVLKFFTRLCFLLPRRWKLSLTHLYFVTSSRESGKHFCCVARYSDTSSGRSGQGHSIQSPLSRG